MSSPPRLSPATGRVLRVFLEHPETWRYGTQVRQASQLPGGTVYPILARLEQAGWLESHWEAVQPPDRPRRRYHRLTSTGIEEAGAALSQSAATPAVGAAPDSSGVPADQPVPRAVQWQPHSRRAVVVVGANGSDLSKHALIRAAQEAQLRTCLLRVVYGWQSHEPQQASPDQLVRGWVEEALTGDARNCPIEVVVPRLPPASAVLLATDDAELVVLGTGTDPTDGGPPGPVSRDCLARSHVPVLLVQPPLLKWDMSPQSAPRLPTHPPASASLAPSTPWDPSTPPLAHMHDVLWMFAEEYTNRQIAHWRSYRLGLRT
jgi:DNA-binding PadR family transcriptional regulator